MRGAAESRHAPSKRRKLLKTVRLDHLSATLLAVAAAGLLAAVGLVVFLYAQPAEANFPGKPGKIVYAGRDAPNGDYEIYTINSGGGARNHSQTTPRTTTTLPTRLRVSA